MPASLTMGGPAASVNPLEAGERGPPWAAIVFIGCNLRIGTCLPPRFALTNYSGLRNAVKVFAMLPTIIPIIAACTREDS